MIKDSKTGYGIMTILLHWVCATLVIFLFGLGVYMRGLDYYSPWYHRGPDLHIALGILVVALMLLRLVWRKINATPEAVPGQTAQATLAATAVKMALYALVFIIGGSGYLITTAEGSGANFFDLFSIPATVELSSTQVDLAGKIHKFLAWGTMGVVTLHAGAALFHHFFKRDNTLRRMLKPAK